MNLMRKKKLCLLKKMTFLMTFIKRIIKKFVPYYIVIIYRKINQPKNKLLRFDLHLVDHCNLNCKGCEHFSPIAEKKFLDINIYERDCIRLNKLTGGKIEDISLLGGEPLLHPRIIDFMSITRKYFPIGKIRIITNGILLENQENVFWEACKENDIQIFISVYPVNINYLNIEEKAKKFGIKLIFWGDKNNRSKRWKKLKIDITGRQSPRISNFLCYGSNYCFQLVDGKIFKCWRIAYIHHFNKTFGKELKVTNCDYFDIYKLKNIKELLDKIRKPVPFCKYCNIMHSNYDEKWEHSQKVIEEWI